MDSERRKRERSRQAQAAVERLRVFLESPEKQDYEAATRSEGYHHSEPLLESQKAHNYRLAQICKMFREHGYIELSPGKWTKAEGA